MLISVIYDDEKLCTFEGVPPSMNEVIWILTDGKADGYRVIARAFFVQLDDDKQSLARCDVVVER